MRAIVGGQIWEFVTVAPGDPGLVDRTGEPRLAVADPAARQVRISSEVRPPLLDRVVLHEVAHAIAFSRGLLPSLYMGVPASARVHAEEWAASFVERYGIEVADTASRVLGRPVCVEGLCHA